LGLKDYKPPTENDRDNSEMERHYSGKRKRGTDLDGSSKAHDSRKRKRGIDPDGSSKAHKDLPEDDDPHLWEAWRARGYHFRRYD